MTCTKNGKLDLYNYQKDPSIFIETEKKYWRDIEEEEEEEEEEEGLL